jgi:hypothetical protein
MSEAFLIQNDVKEGKALASLLFSFALEHAKQGYKKIRRNWKLI